MKTILNSLFLLTVILLQGCMPAPSNTRKASVASASTTGGTKATGSGIGPTFVADENVYWFTTSKITGTVTLNKNTQDIIYLRGKLVHDFLNSKDSNGSEYYRKQYCMVGNFSNSSYKQVRVRAIPIYVTTSTKAIERLLRIDIPSDIDNSSTCKPTTFDPTIPALAAYSLPEICLNCSGQVTTSNLNLFESKTIYLPTNPPTPTTTLTKILTTQINLSTVLIKVDLTSNSTDSGSTCTNSSCSAKGFDCCISGQCVKDASEKTNASADPQYNQAKIDSAANSLSFINYPNIYYICSNIAHTPTTTTPTTTSPLSDAQARVASYLADYTCITGPFDSNGNSTCTTYVATKIKLAVACGCTAIGDQIAVKCPDWGVLPVYPAGAIKTNANITDFTCYTPAPANPIGPITNLNVSVPNRSAPHRFFSSTGVSYDDIAGLIAKTPAITQEGEDFYYLDEYNKVGPVSGTFNINSVIGRMTIDLSHALPSKMVAVELGKTYILSATSGFFTPCSQCVKDSWFQAFSAHPTTQRGTGLQASGYSTSRDTYAGNSTFGNYEDTKFGRACYVPVTMLPLSHQKNTSLISQRQNRLKTQTAFYMNGYQRDWYGFNKGALIGSFDGVTWFAIGTGRRATATSSKLFLALNASFLDLADKTDTIVNIIPDFSANTAADFDYDPEIALTDPRQNTAATCQQFHQCSVDADCVSQLGWEYTCADISQSKTKWPLFDSEGLEIVNQERTGSIFEILHSTISTSNGKRCVYRGAGAPCKRDYSNLSEYNKKPLTCAPNFYCASITTNKFNDELVRSPNELDDMLYGMDANILGRPLKYVTASKSLLTEIVANIKYNANSAIGLTSTESADMGICRPGKFLSSDAKLAHMNADLSRRTDYISQIGSCDSTAKSSTRFLTCPAFNDELNYVDSSATDPATKLATSQSRQTQNSCGGESKHTSTFISAFKSIEGLSLLNLQNITQPILAKDACFRRAGSICHTDLDCGPNKMHEDIVGSVDIKYFGSTEAEQSYWRESLICGQETPTPSLGTSGYLDYKLNENRCCREIGKDFTMVTQGPALIIPENAGTNVNLITGKFASDDPTKANRYSRYSISKTAINDSTTIPAVPKVPYPSSPPLVEPAPNQWNVINETGSLTCCGGGWIRKFSDGTHDWKVKNRLSMDANNFSCLNFRSPLADSSYAKFTTDEVVSASYQREFEYFCKSPDGAGCFQIPFQPSDSFTILSPLPYDPSFKVSPDPYLSKPSSGRSRLDTSPSSDPIDGSVPWTQFMSSDVPYMPLPYYYSPETKLDVDTKTNKAYNFFTNKTTDFGIEFYLPAYIGWDGAILGNNPSFIKRVYIKYFYDTHTPKVFDITANVASKADCDKVINVPNPFPASKGLPIEYIPSDSTWCVASNSAEKRPVFIVKADTDLAHNWKYAGVIIDFVPIETKRVIAQPLEKVAEPGNALYYLSKLARFELIGIPQITYEPLYCNNNQNKLVPGLFKSIDTRAQFTASSAQYAGSDPIFRYKADASANISDTTSNYGNFEQRFTYQDKLDHSAIFSSKDFTCCTSLGKNTTGATKCCSGHAVNGICKLPKGTDLNVYFNKFVSSEGVGVDQPAGGLTITGTDEEVDFNPWTGEPKYRGSTYDKLVALGGNYCDGAKLVTGGAFGAFPPEPFSGSYTVPSGTSGNLEDSFPMSIVDSVLDFQKSDPNLGKFPFDSGFKWNHHYYCK